MTSGRNEFSNKVVMLVERSIRFTTVDEVDEVEEGVEGHDDDDDDDEEEEEEESSLNTSVSASIHFINVISNFFV